MVNGIKISKFVFTLALALVVCTFVAGMASAVYVSSSSFTGLGSGYSSSSYQYQPTFQTYYGSDASTYWPMLTNSDTCLARQDIIMQVSPTGCQPMVVRSDLIADQNVPVFCQIDALQLNPLLNVKAITNIQFSGTYPKEVANVGFHPARAALNTRDRLLGSPLMSNIGYVVVVLKRTPNESSLPDHVNLNLSGTIQYDAGNAFGVGQNEFYLQPTNDAEWQQEGVKSSFWDGKYFVRVESADTEYAIISLYDGIRKIASKRVKLGETTEPIFMPGYYCQFGLRISYDSLTKADDSARIEINDDRGTNVLDVYKGSNIMNGNCHVQDVYVDPNTGSTGNVRINCGSQSIFLQKNAVLTVDGLPPGQISHKYTDNKEQCRVDFSDGSGYYIERTYDSNSKTNPSGADWSSMQTVAAKTTPTTIPPTKNTQTSVASSVDTEKIRNKLVQACTLTDDPLNGNVNDAAESAFNDADKYYENVADNFPNEAVSDSAGSKKYGQLALQAMLGIINEVKGKGYSKAQTEIRVMAKIASLYPDLAQIYNSKISDLYSYDSTLSSASVNVNNQFKTIRLVSLSKPSNGDKAEAVFMYGNSEIRLKQGEVKSLPGKGEAKVNLTSFDANGATISTNCIELSESDRQKKGGNLYDLALPTRAGVDNLPNSRTFRITNTGSSDNQLLCGSSMVLRDTLLEKVAKVRISPVVQNAEGKTNVSVKIGIEKRSIKLSPDRAKRMINTMNESIKKWEKISNGLVKLETGLKGACLATGVALTVKNFFAGIDGTAAARQDVMSGKNGWNQRCADAVKTGKIDLNGDGNAVQAKGSYSSVSQCLSDYGSEIEADVAKRKKVIVDVNNVVKNIQSKPEITQNGVVNQDKAIAELYKQIPQACKDKYNLPAPSSRFDKKDEQYAPYSYTELVEYYKNCLILRDNPNNAGANASLISQVQLAKNNLDEFNRLGASSVAGDPLASAPKSPGRSGSVDVQGTFYTLKDDNGQLFLNGKKVITSNDEVSKDIKNQLTSNVTDAFLIRDVIVAKGIPKSSEDTIVPGAMVVGTAGPNGKMQQKAVYEYSYDDANGVIKLNTLKAGDKTVSLTDFRTMNNIDSIQQFGQGLYGNSIRQQDRRVLYFISGPDKDLPSQVPFDVNNGWYAKVEPRSLSLGTNAISSYDSSGLPKRWQICNVGDDHMINDNDRCQEIVQGVSSSATILGLDYKTSKDLVAKSQRALLDAASQKGSASKSVNILGQRMDVGGQDPLSNVQCQNFMSPTECKLLFNVCDPVICSPSRCDLGGEYRVANVQQTGIIGSAVLCLPNANEGIVLPVCISGIRNGIDSYISLLKQHRDCLQQNLDDGRLVGICDEIQSIYLCEFFWRQVAPIAQMLLPKLIMSTYSKGEGQYRGGGEYLLTQKAWDNAKAQMDYFTQYYAENMMQAFQIRSVEEVGTEVCRGFISTSIPTKIKTLLEPDSPPQFTARFDEIPYSSVTVPATSHYKVFYFINAGKDSGVYYSVYLKNPPESGFYYSSQSVMIASGFLNKGQSASETLDRTLPEGYKQICVRVNNQEECGFKQTSTSFAVNYLKDKYVKDQMTNTSITSEAACVSGTSSLSAVTANLNLQAAAAEALMPQIYQRGIVRICATNNPGGTSDPTRYVEAGYCGDPKMRCWLDKNSVNNAITDANIGMKNETLSQLEAKQYSDLFGQTGILDTATATGRLTDLDKATAALKNEITKGADNTAKRILDRADVLYINASDTANALILNNHKAWLSYIVGQIKQIKIDYYLNTLSGGSYLVRQNVYTPKASTPKASTPTSTTGPVTTTNAESTSSSSQKSCFDLKEIESIHPNNILYSSKGKFYVYNDYKYLFDTKVLLYKNVDTSKNSRNYLAKSPNGQFWVDCLIDRFDELGYQIETIDSVDNVIGQPFKFSIGDHNYCSVTGKFGTYAVQRNNRIRGDSGWRLSYYGQYSTWRDPSPLDDPKRSILSYLTKVCS